LKQSINQSINQSADLCNAVLSSNQNSITLKTDNIGTI